jgi:hypothetical protein
MSSELEEAGGVEAWAEFVLFIATSSLCLILNSPLQQRTLSE